MHAKHGPLTKICFVCSASAAVRGLNLVRRRLGTGPGATLGPPTPAANLESETAALAPRRKQVAIFVLWPASAGPSDPSIRTRWPTALVVAAITPTASHAAPGAAASYQTSGRSHTAAGVVGHGMLIRGPEGLMHAKLGPVTEICFVCSASAAMRAQPRSEPRSRWVA